MDILLACRLPATKDFTKEWFRCCLITSKRFIVFGNFSVHMKNSSDLTAPRSYKNSSLYEVSQTILSIKIHCLPYLGLAPPAGPGHKKHKLSVVLNRQLPPLLKNPNFSRSKFRTNHDHSPLLKTCGPFEIWKLTYRKLHSSLLNQDANEWKYYWGTTTTSRLLFDSNAFSTTPPHTLSLFMDNLE